jgi:tetratricopeptide (TPR) repeat protein
MTSRTLHARSAALAALLAAACGGGGKAAVRPDASERAPATAARAADGDADVRPQRRADGDEPRPKAGSAPQLPAPPPARTLSPRAQRLFDEAVAAGEEMKRLKVPTDWETLERRWRAVLEAEPVPEAWFNVGVALEKRRRLDDARAAYARALELDPQLSQAAVNLALLDEPKDPAQAAARWSELMRRFPEDPVPRARLAALYEAAGQHDDAWRLAREALVRDPRSLAAYKVMMRTALARGNADLAHLLAVKALKLEADDPEIVSFVGDVLHAKKDEPAALAQWKKAVALKDDYLPPRYALLEHALSKQLWESAAEQARAILRGDPNDARVQLALGVAYRYLGKPDQAFAAYDQAEKLGAGRLAEVHLARGVALMKTKEQCEPALAELRRYVNTAGPGVASEGPTMRLMRECEGILAANREAEEAARQMKAEAEREAAKKAAAPPAAKPAAATGSEAQATPRPAEASAAARQAPTR